MCSGKSRKASLATVQWLGRIRSQRGSGEPARWYMGPWNKRNYFVISDKPSGECHNLTCLRSPSALIMSSPWGTLLLPFFSRGIKANLNLLFGVFVLFWPCPWYAEVPRPEIKPKPQGWPEPQQWQWWINPLSHTGTPTVDILIVFPSDILPKHMVIWHNWDHTVWCLMFFS